MFVLGWIWMCHGGYDNAVQHLTHVLNTEPLHAPAYSLRGVAWSHLGLHKRALGDSFRAMALRPENSVYRENTAVIYEALGQKKRAQLTRLKI